jgi:hypothetical protein
LAVEKDYWVCEVPRAIVAAHPGQVIFKGGTSLEKLTITQRFSEDIDIIVVGEYTSKNAAKNALKAMMETAASATGGELSDAVSGGDPGNFSPECLPVPAAQPQRQSASISRQSEWASP